VPSLITAVTKDSIAAITFEQKQTLSCFNIPIYQTDLESLLPRRKLCDNVSVVTVL
jgi:hypothetical protein